MSKYDIVNEVFGTIGEIARKSDFIFAGLKDQDVYALCKQGYLERVKKGYYKLAVGDEPKEELILSKLMTHGVICVESALFYYGYSDFAPREWSIAVPRSYSRTVKVIQTEVPVKAYYVQNPMYHLGETTGTFNGAVSYTHLDVYKRQSCSSAGSISSMVMRVAAWDWCASRRMVSVMSRGLLDRNSIVTSY